MFLTPQPRTVIRLTFEIARISTGDYYRRTQELRRCAAQILLLSEFLLMPFLVCHSCTSTTDILTSYHCCARVTQRVDRGDFKSSQRLSETSSNIHRSRADRHRVNAAQRNGVSCIFSYLGAPLGLTKARAFSALWIRQRRRSRQSPRARRQKTCWTLTTSPRRTGRQGSRPLKCCRSRRRKTSCPGHRRIR